MKIFASLTLTLSIYIYMTGSLALWVECLAKARETKVKYQVSVMSKTQKMLLDASLLST